MVTHDGITINNPQIERIQLAVSNHFGIGVDRLVCRDRTKWLAIVRMLAMYLTRELTESSLPEIGAAFGRDHTTVLHAIRRVSQILRSDKRILVAYEDIKKSLS